MGDSISAAFAARGTLLEDRDIAWSGGRGDDAHLTLPYMLGKVSGTVLEGTSQKAVVPKVWNNLPHNDYHPGLDHLNVAESSGGVGQGSLQEQWGILQEQFPNYKDFNSRWKVMTVWMMANDICGQCAPLAPSKVDKYINTTREFLNNVTSTMTNIYVNMIPSLDLSNVHRIQQTTSLCKWEHGSKISPFSHECGCIDKGNATQLAYLDANIHIVNKRLHDLVAEFHSQISNSGRKDIAIVTQGFMEFQGASLDRSFFSTLDCFHPSSSAHQDLAIALWNSMLCMDNRSGFCGSPISQDIPVHCPTKDSVFYTGSDVVIPPPKNNNIEKAVY